MRGSLRGPVDGAFMRSLCGAPERGKSRTARTCPDDHGLRARRETLRTSVDRAGAHLPRPRCHTTCGAMRPGVAGRQASCEDVAALKAGGSCSVDLAAHGVHTASPAMLRVTGADLAFYAGRVSCRVWSSSVWRNKVTNGVTVSVQGPHLRLGERTTSARGSPNDLQQPCQDQEDSL